MNIQVKELNEILNECKKFARNEIRDHALETDLNPSSNIMQQIWSKSEQLDIPALLLPEVYGGAGYSEFCCALVLDAFASECAGIASVFAHHFAACLPLMGDDGGCREKYLTQIAHREGFGAAPATVIFPSALGDHGFVLTRKGDSLVLSGTTLPVGNTDFAGLFCLFAEDPIQKDGVTCLFIERNRLEDAFGETTNLPGLKMNPFRQLCVHELEVSRDDIVGERGTGLNLMKKARSALFSFVSAMAMGSARTACQKAVSYAKQRYQYGNTIIHHQEIQRMLGNMLMKLNVGTSGYVQLFSEEKLNLLFSSPDPMLTKSFCTDMAMEIVVDAIQIHGGYGYMHEYGLEKIMRDVKVLQLLEGSNVHHHVQVISDQL